MGTITFTFLCSFMLNICRCLTDRVGALPCSDVLQLTESDVETNMMIIVVVILSVTGILIKALIS